MPTFDSRKASDVAPSFTNVRFLAILFNVSRLEEKISSRFSLSSAILLQSITAAAATFHRQTNAVNLYGRNECVLPCDH